MKGQCDSMKDKLLLHIIHEHKPFNAPRKYMVLSFTMSVKMPCSLCYFIAGLRATQGVLMGDLLLVGDPWPALCCRG